MRFGCRNLLRAVASGMWTRFSYAGTFAELSLIKNFLSRATSSICPAWSGLRWYKRRCEKECSRVQGFRLRQSQLQDRQNKPWNAQVNHEALHFTSLAFTTVPATKKICPDCPSNLYPDPEPATATMPRSPLSVWIQVQPDTASPQVSADNMHDRLASPVFERHPTNATATTK